MYHATTSARNSAKLSAAAIFWTLFQPRKFFNFNTQGLFRHEKAAADQLSDGFRIFSGPEPSREPVVTTRALLPRTRDCGCTAHPAIPAASFFLGADDLANLGRVVAGTPERILDWQGTGCGYDGSNRLSPESGGISMRPGLEPGPVRRDLLSGKADAFQTNQRQKLRVPAQGRDGNISNAPTPRSRPRPRDAVSPIALPRSGCCLPRWRQSRIAGTTPIDEARRIWRPRRAGA